MNDSEWLCGFPSSYDIVFQCTLTLLDRFNQHVSETSYQRLRVLKADMFKLTKYIHSGGYITAQENIKPFSFNSIKKNYKICLPYCGWVTVGPSF
jgi:hypothetical protein